MLKLRKVARRQPFCITNKSHIITKHLLSDPYTGAKKVPVNTL